MVRTWKAVLSALGVAAATTAAISAIPVIKQETTTSSSVRSAKDLSKITPTLASEDPSPGRADTSSILIAKAGLKRIPLVQTGPELVNTHLFYVAYAPALADVHAPFDALFDDSVNQIGIPPTLPRTRPNKIDTAKYMTGHGPQRRRPGEHKWAANTLPSHVYKAAQQDCLARGIYFEGRGESARGQAAIAQVILNRVKNPAFPSTICDVVYQNEKQLNACQFSFACDGISDSIRSTKPYRIAQNVARKVTDGNIWLPEVGDATHYHATYVQPKWAGKLTKKDRIGRHIFYRTTKGGWS